MGGGLFSPSWQDGATLSISELDAAMEKIKPTFFVMSKWSRHLFCVWRWKPIDRRSEVVWRLDRNGLLACFYRDVQIMVTDFTREGQQVLDYNEQFGDCPCTTSIYVIGDHKGELFYPMERFTLTRELLDSIEDKIVISGIRKGEFSD